MQRADQRAGRCRLRCLFISLQQEFLIAPRVNLLERALDLQKLRAHSSWARTSALPTDYSFAVLTPGSSTWQRTPSWPRPGRTGIASRPALPGVLSALGPRSLRGYRRSDRPGAPGDFPGSRIGVRRVGDVGRGQRQPVQRAAAPGAALVRRHHFSPRWIPTRWRFRVAHGFLPGSAAPGVGLIGVGAFVGGVFVLPGEVGTGRIVAPALVSSCGCEARTAHWSTAGRKAAVGHGGRQPTEFLSRSDGTARSAQESPWHPGRTGPWSGPTVASGVPGRKEAETGEPPLPERTPGRPGGPGRH